MNVHAFVVRSLRKGNSVSVTYVSAGTQSRVHSVHGLSVVAVSCGGPGW